MSDGNTLFVLAVITLGALEIAFLLVFAVFVWANSADEDSRHGRL